MLSESGMSLKSCEISSVKSDPDGFKKRICCNLVSAVQSHTLGLVENGEVGRVDLVPAINITYNDEVVQSRRNQFFLVSTRVTSKDVVFIHVVAIGSAATRVVMTYQ